MPPPYKSPGRCIYCGVIPLQLADLTDEHIVPETLSAFLVLPNSSCVACQKIINKFETAALRGPLLQGRLLFNLKRNASGTGPKDLKVTINDGEIRQVRVGHDHVPALVLPLLNGPLALLGLPPNFGPVTYGLGFVWDEVMVAKAKARLDAQGISQLQLGTPNVIALARTLCKIAHAFAVAELGWGKVIPLLTDEILGKSTLFPNYYVGSSFITKEACELHLDGLHDLSWRRVVVNKIPYLVLRVQLFSLLAAPAYDVVVGIYP
jgi:hypothetical protein